MLVTFDNDHITNLFHGRVMPKGIASGFIVLPRKVFVDKFMQTCPMTKRVPLAVHCLLRLHYFSLLLLVYLLSSLRAAAASGRFLSRGKISEKLIKIAQYTLLYCCNYLPQSAVLGPSKNVAKKISLVASMPVWLSGNASGEERNCGVEKGGRDDV